MRGDRRLKRKVLRSYAVSTVSLALVLFLLGSVGYLILNALTAAERMKEGITVYVMLGEGLDGSERDEVGRRLAEHPAVRETKFVSKEQAAAEFKEYVGSDFEEFLKYNPLPDQYEVGFDSRSVGREAVAAFEREVSGWKGVDEVVYQRGVVENMAANLGRFAFVLLLFGGTLLVICLILLNNTVRLSIFSRRYLIETMKLVGASRWFIIRPFVRDAVLQGVYAGIAAVLLFAGMLAGLKEGMGEALLRGEYITEAVVAGSMLVAGILLSLLFTIFAVNKFVNIHSGKIYLY